MGEKKRDFPGGSVVRTPRFHCSEHRFDPWVGKLRFPHAPQLGQKVVFVFFFKTNLVECQKQKEH